MTDVSSLLSSAFPAYLRDLLSARLERESQTPPAPPPESKRKTAIRFKSLADLRRFMARILNDLEAGRIAEGKARVLGYLSSVLMGIIKDSDLEARITKLEQEAAKNENKP